MAKAKQSADIEVDWKTFQKSIKLYMKATNKSTADALNHAAGQAALRSTKRAIMPSASLSGALGAQGNPSKTRARWKYENRLFFALAVKNGATVGNRRAMAERLWKSRRSSVGFIRANFGAIARKLGVRTSARFPREPDFKYSKATPNRHIAELWNAKLEGKGGAEAYDKLDKGFRRAVHAALFDKNGLVPYAQRKIKENWKKAGRRSRFR